jgi:hypothetical protein
MLNADTIKIGFTEDSIKDLNTDCFRKMPIEDMVTNVRTGEQNRELTKTEYKLYKEYKNLGITKINLIEHEFGYNGEIEFSAKILKEDYFDLININNIEKVIENVNGKGISFNENFVNGELHRIDVANLLKMDNSIDIYLSVLQSYKSNHKYDVKPYKYQGIQFVRDVTTNERKDRLICYDKYREIKRDKRLTDYININDFYNHLKVESNLRHFLQMRKYFKTDNKKIKLIDALNSNIPVNFNFLKDVTNMNFQFELLLKDTEGKNLTESEKWKGRERIIELCNRDAKLIRKYIRSKYSGKSKPTRAYKLYSELLRDMESRKVNREIKLIGINDKYIIDELKDKLRGAA